MVEDIEYHCGHEEENSGEDGDPMKRKALPFSCQKLGIFYGLQLMRGKAGYKTKMTPGSIRYAMSDVQDIKSLLD